MEVVLYANGKNKATSIRLQKAVESKILHEPLGFFQTIEDFSTRLRQLPRAEVVVLLAQSHHELSKLISLKDFLEYARIILILPDSERETVSKGLKLYPRFLSYVDSDFKDVAAVLEKMLDHIRNQKNYRKGGEIKCQN